MVTSTALLLLCGMSFLAGFVDSIAGGGGLLLLPSFLLAGLPPQSALGTNKFSAMFGTATALVNFALQKKVLWKIAAIGLPFTMIGAVSGTKLVLFCDQATTAKIILFLLPVTAMLTFLPKKRLKTSLAEFSTANLYLHVPVMCGIIGFYDGFFGPGTGTFLIFGFYLFLGLHLIQASAIAKVFNLASNVSSFATFALAGKVLYPLGLPIALANMLGGYLGSHLAIRRGQRLIQSLLLAVFFLLFVTVIFKIRHGF